MVRKDSVSKVNLRHRIALYRKHFHLTQSELGASVGVSKNTISSIERYEFYPSVILAYSLCSFFNCKFEELFYVSGDKP